MQVPFCKLKIAHRLAYKKNNSSNKPHGSQSTVSSNSIQNLEKRLQTLIQNFFTQLLVSQEITFNEDEGLSELCSFNFVYD